MNNLCARKKRRSDMLASGLLFAIIASAVLADEKPQIVGETISRVPADGIVGKGDSISCYKNKEPDPDFQWFTVDESGSETPLVLDSDDAGDNSIIQVEMVDVTYRCKLDEENFADFSVGGAETKKLLAFKVVKFDKSYSVVENDDLKVECKVANRTQDLDLEEDVVLKWYVYATLNDEKSYVESIGNCSENLQESLNWHEVVVESDPNTEQHIRIIDKGVLRRSVLKIEDADRSKDRRAFKCVAYMRGARSNCSESAFFVRVRDKYAALWPFVGIVAEVVIVCLIICVCEKRKSTSTKGADAADDDDDDDINGKAANSGLRHRGKN